MNNLKNLFIATFSIMIVGIITLSCNDILSTDTDYALTDYDLNLKSDSIFMAYGIMQTLQELADQYVLTSEMRGDLVDTTHYTNEELRELANFSATSNNSYNSPYVYYAVINNCNYYIAHRDTALRTGSSYVIMNEYAAVKAFRAWAYLMLARNYERIFFYTEPLVRISDIDNKNFPELSLLEIVEQLAPDLEQYASRMVPDYGEINCGTNNAGKKKTAQSKLCFIPVDVILGELYLEAGRYEKAIECYQRYIDAQELTLGDYIASVTTHWYGEELPIDFYTPDATSWSSIWSTNATADIVTYIPMATNKLNGTTTQLPLIFGYDYYTTSSSDNDRYVEEIQISPSQIYTTLADSADYYYASNILATEIKSVKLGDMRRGGTFSIYDDREYMRKYQTANVVLFRQTTIWLHLAEALNRAGRYSEAFDILKSGVHKHGCGYTYGTLSEYQMDTIVGKKMKEIKQTFEINADMNSPQDTINAIEDLLCDEYAMELAFEGTRFFDLCRMARHKNKVALYSSNFGSIWLAKKLEFKQLQKDMTQETNWYLPFR